MKTILSFQTLFLLVLFAFVSLPAQAADSASLVGLDFRSPSSPGGMMTGAVENQSPASQESDAPAQEPISMPLANPQSLRVEGPALEGGRADIGRFESRATLKFRDGEYTFFQIAVSLRLTDGTLKSVLTSGEYRPGNSELLDEESRADLEARFAFELETSLEHVKKLYGPSALASLKQLGVQYVRTSTAQIPEAIPALIEKARELEARGESRVESYPLTQLSGSRISDLSLRKEFFEKSEDLAVIKDSFREGRAVPRYENRQKFVLTDLGHDGASRYFLAAVDYRFVTIPEKDGRFKTVFTLSLRYKGETEITHTETFLHEALVEERKFMPKWRNLLVARTMDKLTAQAGTNREKVERALFVSYLEPYLYDLYYDFSPALLKARLGFDSPSVQKEIHRLEKALS